MLLDERRGSLLGVDLPSSSEVENLLVFQPLLRFVIERGGITGHRLVEIFDGRGKVLASFRR